MSREIVSLADRDTIKACEVLATSQILTVPSLLDILGKVPGLVRNLVARLEVQYDRTETLRMQVKDLQGKLAQWDSERRGIVVMRDKFGARPEENDVELVTRIHQEQIDAQAEVARLSSALTLMTERAEAAERCAARAERTSDATLHARVEILEAETQHLTGHSGLSISNLVHEAYQTAKDKGWHDPADENDVTVVEARQALCREGLRALHLCSIAEMLRKGQKPGVHEYLRLMQPEFVSLDPHKTRLISDLMLVITEVGEAISDGLFDHVDEEVDEKGKPTGLPSELADVLIRVAHICGHRKIDLAGAVQRKLKFNKTRPYKHGKRA